MFSFVEVIDSDAADVMRCPMLSAVEANAAVVVVVVATIKQPAVEKLSRVEDLRPAQEVFRPKVTTRDGCSPLVTGHVDHSGGGFLPEFSRGHPVAIEATTTTTPLIAATSAIDVVAVWSQEINLFIFF
ncbi:hypothetical protein EUGRSUZ_I01160 [Eucalyptus grandis]|uniref:Uncharacterized protein n=2 Tax=Eucalyptus grandis TaxID=71139 RepID=A0ACC3JGY8_EUCGR|nr:hypothetical protein EUGRSUZ_I01160 [Eucalyptus grandis]